MRSLAAIGEMNKERSYPMCFGQCECESGSACVAGLAHADETVSIPHLKGDQNRRRGRIGSKRTAQTATIEVYGLSTHVRYATPVAPNRAATRCDFYQTTHIRSGE